MNYNSSKTTTLYRLWDGFECKLGRMSKPKFFIRIFKGDTFSNHGVKLLVGRFFLLVISD